MQMSSRWAYSTSRPPAPTPGIECGRKILIKVRNGLAPSDCDARSCASGMVFITLNSGSTMNGRRICDMAMSVPVSL